MIETEITMLELANVLDMDLDTPEIYDLAGLGLEVESMDENSNPMFKEITDFLIKPSVNKYYKLGELNGTGEHRVLYNGNFIKLKNHPDAELITGKMNVVDISVSDTETYIANGQVNHNTTSGGLV
jgi:hypothetical protein